MVCLELSTNVARLTPLVWTQFDDILEILVEYPDGFPYPVVGRIRNVTAKSYEYLPSPDIGMPNDDFRWTKWSRIPTPQSKIWCSGKLQVETVAGTNLPLAISSIKAGTRICLVERLRVIDEAEVREKHFLQVMDIFVAGDVASAIQYRIRGFDRSFQHRSGFSDVVPIVYENRSCWVPTKEIAGILRDNVVLNPVGGQSRLYAPWLLRLRLFTNRGRT